MKFDTTLGSFEVKEVGENEEDWIVVKSQSVTFEKSSFFLNEFNKDFPGFKLLGSSDLEKYTFLAEACAKSPVMREWLASTSVKYSETTQLPLYLKDRVAPDEYKDLMDKIMNIKEELSRIVVSRNELAKDYNDKLSRLKDEEDRIVKRLIGQNNTLKVLYLNSECLPFSIQLKVQGYNPRNIDEDVAVSKRRLTQEYLAKFKIALLDMIKEKPDIDLDTVLKEVSIK